MKQKSWISIVFSFASQCKAKIILSVLCAIVSVIAGMIPYWSVYQIISLFICGSPVMSEVWKWCLIGLGAYAVRFLMYGISTSLSHISAYTILENIRLSLAKRLMSAPLGTVLGESVGKLKNVLVDRVETIEFPLAHMIPECISNLLLPIAVFIYLVCIDWRMALAMLVTVPLVFIAFAIMMKNFNKQYADYMESNNYVNGVIVEYVEGIEVIKAFNQSSSSYEKFAKAVQSFKDYTLKWYQSTWKLMNFISAVLPSTFLGTLPIGMYLYLNGGLAPQDLVMCLILSLGIVGPLMNFTTYVNEAKAVEYAVHDVDKLLHVEELPDTGVPVQVHSKDIELQDVSFSYDKEGGRQALSHIDLKIPEGKFTALVGPSGGGKSTIARLITRFWDVCDGKITIGEVDIRNIPLSQLADIISFVTQDNFLFNCSIKENIRLGNPDATDEEVYAAAKAACCDEFIQKLDSGYDTMAGDAGNRLSGGEKQRISIARMILKNAPIVILDEATAFTDQENEEKIQQSIAALTKGKTLLVLGAMILAVIGRYLFAYLRAVTQESVGYEATADVRIRLGDILKRVSLGFFSKNNIGELSAAATTDLSFLEMFAMNMVNTVVNGYITVMVLILFLVFYSPLAGGIALAGVLLSAMFLHLLEARSRQNALVHQKAQDDMVESSIEYLRGMQVVKAFKQEGVSIAGIRKAYRDSKKINIKIEVEYMPFNCLHLFSLKTASIAIVAVAALLTYNGSMGLPTMLMLDMFSFMIFGSVEAMNNAAHVLEVIDAALDKLEGIEYADIIDKDGKDIPLQDTDITFRNVTFSYDKTPVLHNVSFTIPQGSTTAIVGPSGSGKTTICSLIARFYDVNSGEITVGGENVRDMTCDNLLRNISMVFQKVYLFHDTMENNIRFGNPGATEEEIIEAAKKARCHDFIKALSDGYQTMVGEGGSTLSGGEKQRISIARAILKNASIVILDEATASIDPENEHLIQQAISELTIGKTVIVIAHRLATIEHADQILVVDNGQIVQSGTHGQLIQQEGVYKRFINIREQAEGWSIA